MVSKRWTWSFLVLLVLGTLLSACGGETDPTKPTQTTITMFADAGQASERDALNASIKAFQDNNPDIIVKVSYQNENSYETSVASAALAGNLPCVLEINGPSVYNYAWHHYLTTLDKYVTDDIKSDLLPSIINQGTYNNHLYSVGQYDSGLSLYANKSDLQKAGVRIPTFDEPWTLDEFNDALAKLKTVSGVQFPLDLMVSYGVGEWFTYGYSPFLQSFGGDLVNRKDYQNADGALNGPEAIAAMTWFQNLFNKKYVDTQPPDNNEFPSGKAALAWSGHWQYSTYKQQLGDNLIVLPAPNLGKGPKTGMGSWSWGITSSCKDPDKAWKVINFLLSPDEITRMTNANSAVPARKSVVDKSSLYKDGGDLHVMVQQLEDDNIVVPRPLTPAYTNISTAFYTAAANIKNGADVKGALDDAVQKIDKDIKDHNGYPVK